MERITVKYFLDNATNILGRVQDGETFLIVSPYGEPLGVLIDHDEILAMREHCLTGGRLF